MRRRGFSGRFPASRVASAGALVALLALSRNALAYIDPGTTQALWTSLGPLIGILAGCLGILFFPLRLLWQRLRAARQHHPDATRRLLISTGVLAAAAAATGGWYWVWRLISGSEATVTATTDPVKPRKYDRVVVLGIDGLDPNLLESWMDQGKLPNFDRLRKSGLFSRLATAVPPESPVAWMSAATGVNPGRHGIYDFIGRDPKTYLPELSILKVRAKGPMGLSGSEYAPPSDATPFWATLSERGIRTHVIRWPVTFPPREVNGVLLSGLGAPDVTGALGTYSFITTAPLAPNDKAPERVIQVEWTGDVIETALPGPQVAGLTGAKRSHLPMRLTRNGNGGLDVQFGKSGSLTLRVGEWSGWFPIQFPAGFSKKCPAMVRLYLTSLEPDLNLYISPLEIDPASPSVDITWPASFSKELAGEMGRFATLGLPEDTQAARHGRIPMQALLISCEDITTEREAMLRRELKGFDSGLLAIVFDTSDRIQHMFRAAGNPNHPAHTREFAQAFGGVIEAHYRRMDAALGTILDAVGDDTAVFVLSDHGFADFARAAHLNTWLFQHGFLALKEDAAEGEPLLKNVDWSRTKAYAVGFCGLYVNLRGRESKGIVVPGDERRKLIEELSRGLRDWRDEPTGEPVVRNTYVAEEIYHGERLADAPDLVLGYYPGYRGSWQTALGAAPAGAPVVPNDDLWSGDHLVDAPCVPGIFLTNLPLAAPNPRLIDLAPTVLKTFGIDEPGMDGQPLL
jgi:predicted AlkP superfamily phosphohydrolase/phosphomutase